MLNLAELNVYVEVNDRNIALGHVIKQNHNSVLVNCININTFMPVYREYAFPDAFEDGTLCVQYRGKANDVLLESISLIRQYKAINITLDNLDIDEDLLCKSLVEKRENLKRRLSTIQEEFKNALIEDKHEEEMKRCWEYIEEKKKSLDRGIALLMSDVELVKRYKNDFENYSGFKFRKEYKQLKSRFEQACSTARARINNLISDEEDLRVRYNDMGMEYQIKYSQMAPIRQNNTDSYHLILDYFAEFKKSNVAGNHK